MDVFDAIEQYGPWDLGIFHPDCTYLTIAAEWCYSDEAAVKAKARGSTALFGEKRRQAREEAIDFFRRLWECEIENVCIENPIGVIPRELGLPFTQIVQPYEYGHDAKKATCLWLRGNLEPLVPMSYVEPMHGCSTCKHKYPLTKDTHCLLDGTKFKEVWGNQTPSGQNKLGPSEKRWMERAETYSGIAEAMADTWAPVCTY